MSLTSLKFYAAYKLTMAMNGKDYFNLVALAVHQDEAALPGGEMGVALRYIVNSPERFEQRVTGFVLIDTPSKFEIQQVPEDPSEDIYVFRFEPLTLESWRSMKDSILGFEELEQEVHSDEELFQYYWHDWVPEYWAENPPSSP